MNCHDGPSRRDPALRSLAKEQRLMKRSWLAALTLVTASLLAACGGGDPDVPGSGSPSGAPTTPGEFAAVVSFGDSLSDVGTYAPATSLAGNGTAPYFGGKFTTNGAAGTVWVENLAASLGLLVTPAQVGFAGSSVPCPAAADPALAGTCTAYGQGGARVTDPNGIGKATGALTVPVATQVANHLARFGTFSDSDLIMVWAGNNDVFIQFGEFAAAAAQIQADAAAGRLTSDQANNALFAAQTQAQAAIKQAALELATLVRTGILANGGKYVAVFTLPDSGDTPFGQSVPASARQVLSDLSALFNLWLAEGLTGQPVGLVDARALYKSLLADPAGAGFANATVPACDPAKISAITGGQVTDGSSLFCNATVGVPYNGLRTDADARTWLFADGVHPSAGGHAAISDAVAEQLAAFGWL
jgi:phospholipase/lecithinase/hemolysin